MQQFNGSRHDDSVARTGVPAVTLERQQACGCNRVAAGHVSVKQCSSSGRAGETLCRANGANGLSGAAHVWE